MIRGIVFDLDHTLFDRYGTLTEIAPYFYSYFDVAEDMTPEKIADIWCQTDRDVVYFGWDAVVKDLAEKGVFRTVPTVETYGNFLRGMFMRIAVPFDCTKDVLESLHKQGYKLGLITNGPSELQRKKLSLLGIENAFDDVLITGEFGVHKPDTAPFFEVAKRLDLSPSELLYVGDNPLNDVEASRNAGYTPVWVRTAGYWAFPDIEKPPLQIDHIRELPQLVANLE